MLLLIILFLIWLAVVLFSRLSLLRVQAHWHAKQTIVTQFSTPHNLTPAEFGYIFDRKFGRNEMMGTIVGLVQRKILTLTAKSQAFDNDLIISAERERPNNNKMDDCEAVLIGHITYSEGGARSWKEMRSVFSREAGTRWQYERSVVMQLIVKGYLTDNAKSEPFVDRFVKGTVSLIITWYFLFIATDKYITKAETYSGLDSFVFSLMLVPVFLVACFAFYVYLSVLTHEFRISAGAPRFATGKLRSEWRDVVGFRDYLRVVEWHRLQSQPDLGNKLLPYCLAGGFRIDMYKAVANADKK